MTGKELCTHCRLFERCMKIMLKNPQVLDMDCRAETKETLRTFDKLIASIDKNATRKAKG